MPRLKKKVDPPISHTKSRELPETLTAGRSRRTIKPNPKYMNNEMLVVPSKALMDDDNSDEEYILDYNDDDPDESGLVLRKSIPVSTPQTDGQPKRRGRPPKNKPVDAPRTEPVKNIRKDLLKKMDYKTISISKSRHMMGSQFGHDTRRKLEMNMDSIDSESGDHEDMDDMEMEGLSSRSNDGSEPVNRSQKVLNPAAFKKHLTGKTILDRRGSGANKSSLDDKMIGGTTEDDDFEDDDEFFEDSDSKISEAEPVPVKRSVGRPRKHPLKKVSPFGGKVLVPGMKASPVGTVLKRKMHDDDDSKHESAQSKMLRRSYGLKSANSMSRSNEADSDENEEEEGKQVKRTNSFPTFSRSPGRPPKAGYLMQGKADKLQGRTLSSKEGSNVGNRSFPESKSSKSPTITIVNVNDIMKMKSKSSADIRRRMDFEQMDEEEGDSVEVSDTDEGQSNRNQESSMAGDRPKTNNQLVATILERKRPIPLEHIQDIRKRGRQMELANKTQIKAKRNSRGVTEVLTEDGIVDFEDVLHKNILSAKANPRSVTVGAMRGRGRPSENSHPNENYGGGYNKGQRGGRFGQGKGVVLGKRASQPPRILNATMKLGGNLPRSKQLGGSGDNHYSIDLTDPDNNVKLVASNENSPNKRVSLPSVGEQLSPFAPKAMGNMAKPRTLQEVKKRRVTCYETWNVIHIKSVDSTIKPPSLAFSMIGLGNIAADIKLPSAAWSLRTVLEKRKVPAVEGDEIFCGEVTDNPIAKEDVANYEPNRVMFRRKASSPVRFNVQYDRTVSFRNDSYTVNIDGQSCTLMAAPSRLETVEDIETLLAIVDYADLKNGCIDLPMSARVEKESNAGVKRVAGSKEMIIL